LRIHEVARSSKWRCLPSTQQTGLSNGGDAINEKQKRSAYHCRASSVTLVVAQGVGSRLGINPGNLSWLIAHSLRLLSNANDSCFLAFLNCVKAGFKRLDFNCCVVA